MIVGVTGHQRLAADRWKVIESQVLAYSQANTPFTGVSSLAIGADQLFARIVLATGNKLHVVLPCLTYESNFSKAAREEFLTLIQRAEAVETLNFATASERAFYAAGLRVVDLSDRLLAIWNGRPAKGRGGTGDIVKAATSIGRPVDVIWT